jgi:hypothetical protein
MALTAIIVFSNVKTQNLIQEKPTDIVIADISTQSAEIYWKSTQLAIPQLTYKKTSDTGLYQPADNVEIYQDITSGEQIYKATLSNLDPNSKYVYKIQMLDNTWEYGSYTFKTLNYADKVNIPNIVTGNTEPEELVLVTTGDSNYMVDTQYHGTWALDIEGTGYVTKNYASYKTADDLRAELSSLVSPVYAASGANCKTGIVINDSSSIPSKEKVLDVLQRWTTSCSGGTYGNECFADVSCKSLAAGVDPTFTLAIWAHESDGSNYAYSSGVEDFGIHNATNVSVANFDQQITFFLNNIAGSASNYIKNCNQTDKLAAWGALYYRGDCTGTSALADGKTYMDTISRIYSWYTNEDLTWPFTMAPQSNACSYSNASVNTTYHSCSDTPQDTPDQTGNGNNTGGTTTPTKTVLTVTDSDQYCKDTNGCTCKYSSNGKSFDIANGYTCPATYTGQGTPTVKVCCRTTSGLSMQMPYSCSGTVEKTLTANTCVAQNTTIVIKKGANFIQAQDIVNSDEVTISSAKALIAYTNNKVIAVGLFRNDQWEKIVKVENGIVNGTDFNLVPGESYLVIATEDVNIKAQILASKTAIDLQTLSGWNLIPAYLFATGNINSKGILQSSTYSYINQIAVWNNDSGIFDYNIKDLDGTITGDNIVIPSTDSFFIKITK